MSGADDAFDALMGKHALAIPVANPLSAPAADAGAAVAAAIPAAAGISEIPEIPEVPWAAGAAGGPGLGGGAMRVSDMIDDEAEYVPPAEDEGRFGSARTEADLEAVGDALFGDEPEAGPEPAMEMRDDVESARVAGARVAGRDAGGRGGRFVHRVKDGSDGGGSINNSINNSINAGGGYGDSYGDNDAYAASGYDASGDDGAAQFRDAEEVDGEFDADDESEGDSESDSNSAAGSVTRASSLALDRARRVKRFAYLPLSGAEAFEAAARDMLARLPAADPDRPSLAITSAARGDGRTELAVRLALAMARRVGAKILLADFDVRRPQVAARLGVSTKYFTLADALRGSCSPGEALTVSEEENLYVLPARAADREGDEILDVRAAAAFISRLHAAFDFTILDCGPIESPESAVLCAAAGSVVLAGYCGRSSAVAMRAAAGKLTAGGARLAGIALAGA